LCPFSNRLIARRPDFERDGWVNWSELATVAAGLDDYPAGWLNRLLA
jgi:hypothetical protein